MYKSFNNHSSMILDKDLAKKKKNDFFYHRWLDSKKIEQSWSVNSVGGRKQPEICNMWVNYHWRLKGNIGCLRAN
jgi:hypothetical protein